MNKPSRYLLFCFFLILSSCGSLSTDSVDEENPKMGKYTEDFYIASTGDTLSCFRPITYDELAIYIKNLYQAYREKTKLPKNWTDSDFCDCNYYHTRMQLQNKEHLEFRDRFPPPCLSELLKVMKIKTIPEMRKYEEEIILYIQTTEPERGFIDSARLQKLIEKYGSLAEDCLGKRIYTNEAGKHYVALCNFMMNGAVLEHVRRNWADPGFMYFSNDYYEVDTNGNCFPVDLIIEYQFIEEGDGLELKRRFLNPCVYLHAIVF